MNSTNLLNAAPVPPHAGAALDTAHVGDIRGALGTIKLGDAGHERGLFRRLKTLLAILGPGLIVMVGDNDAGAFSTYAQAGQNYGTTLLWTLALLIPVLYVNQEMVLRLGAVTGVGHARLILERFGKFWGAFSVIDLFLLNALTIVTEFIGIALGLDYLGIPRLPGVGIAAVLVMMAASTGDFRRFERFALILVLGSLLLLPLFVMVHPPMGQVVHDFSTVQMPKDGKLSDVMLLIIGIVGTTIAPWQLFFQQSYVIDKRITPRFIRYERLDLWLGIVLVVLGAVALISLVAHCFAGKPEFGQFTDALGVARGLAQYHGHGAGTLFALALIDASVIGAAAVSLSTAYAVGDVLSVNHSLHRKPREAKGFYLVYCGLIVLAAALVLLPGVPLGLLTNAVQTLAGVLLPSASVFLLLLCNDRQVLGPWVNGRWTNAFTSAVVAVLVILSTVLTAAVIFPDIGENQIVAILVGGGVLATLIGLATLAMRAYRAAVRPRSQHHGREFNPRQMEQWRMPPLHLLEPAQLTSSTRLWMGVLRLYLVLAVAMVAVRVLQLAFAQA
ncbi:Nramp family divalent metal transporter [Roseateles puraquae]|jgi:Mn2+/Fe2+ NRAMP family transporter|uniref:Manganese transporter n=1 Tax=Roseateles puraquae TaxID=431059 RepID=A0A254N6Z9_9BURK|nr:Nramp family divalent metal transporter [Roseateles puraquae]MDG0853035.1 divalent metal cation transporter [Roseateles puraquae]OWR02157.1 manganese transporter [Roseateles puraquae]RTL33972.1 MAG: divalent metal cation transporter [Burkholderiales bacterium]